MKAVIVHNPKTGSVKNMHRG